MTALAQPRPVAVDALRASLHADGASFTQPRWLSDAALDPAAFWAAVAPALMASVDGASRSSPFERYQLAHDLAARHAVGRTAAFGAYDASSSGFEVTSYARIVESARALAGEWLARRAAPGMCVAIVAPMSAELVSALIAAWHVGLVAAPIPAWGRTYVLDRLQALAPDFVATSKGRARWLALAPEHCLPSVALGGPAPGLAHLYAADEPALRVCSPLGDAPLAPFDVPAERLYLGALRDGVLFFGLGAGLAAAAPGFCEAQVGLPLLLSCLATGASFLDMPLADACQLPTPLLDGSIHLLGVRPELRDAVLAGAPGGAGPARWWRNPATAHEPAAWDQLAKTRPFARSLGACYAPSPVAGGAITWSAWRRSPSLNAALPAPGLAWTLVDPGRGGAASIDGNGILTAAEASRDAIGEPLLGQLGPLAGEQMWVTSLGAHRDGQRLPAVELEALVAGRAEIWGAALVDDPRVGAVLVVIARPDRFTATAASCAALAGELTELIALELAPHLVPQRIEVFTVTPHFAKAGAPGAIDRDWCRGQHVSGRLAAKQREPLFTSIARLRLALED